MDRGRRENTKFLLCMMLKYAYTFVFVIVTTLTHGRSARYVAIIAAELILIAIITNELCRLRIGVAYLFNTLACCVINVQYAVLYWGNTFISAAMIDNLDSIRALSGKALVYIGTAILAIGFAALPVCRIKVDELEMTGALMCCLFLWGGAISTNAMPHSPFYALYELWEQHVAWNDLLKEVDGSIDGADEFYSEVVADYIKKPGDLSDSPNVILVFVEGLSQNIIDDERDIMPNLRDLQNRSISFEQYFNHTFATYAGLSGQLYSGYQHSNYDVNTLVSLQGVFSYYGYQTGFINTEPHNQIFTDYLTRFNFDSVVTDEKRVDGLADALSDRSAYELLLNTALQMHSGEESPFFLAMYTMGTHASFDGVYEAYGDGSKTILNRFYDADAQIGKFVEMFENSPLSEDTLVIFTADHATYADADFEDAFPDYEREVAGLDRIPLIFYYHNVSAESYDAGGRNSINMAPTVLDFLDMSVPNYFLGASLFGPKRESLWDATYESLGMIYRTDAGTIKYPEKEWRQQFELSITKYFALKVSDELLFDEYHDNAHLYAELNEDGTAINTELHGAEDWDMFSYAVWSIPKGQDDLKWFAVEGTGENVINYAINLMGYFTEGNYNIDVYAVEEGDLVFVAGTGLNVDRIAEECKVPVK